MNVFRTVVLFSLMLILTASYSHAGEGWLIYHEPELKGTVLDIDTKQPIEGAVVVVSYQKATMGMGAGSISSVIKACEVLTDKEGKFTTPSYTTLIQPFSWQTPTSIIIFKPGYAGLRLGSWHFIEETSKDQEWPWVWFKELKFRIRKPGIVELPQARTIEQRIRAVDDLFVPINYFEMPKQLPHYNQMQEKENGWRHLKQK